MSKRNCAAGTTKTAREKGQQKTTWANWSNIDLQAYGLGYEASKLHDSDPAQYPNPYEPGTMAWQSFNWGWNSHDPDAEHHPPTAVNKSIDQEVITMQTKLYSILNAHAKRWWYHAQLRRQGNHEEARRLECRTILDDLRQLRQAIENGGFLTVGRGGWTLHQGKWNRLTSFYPSLEDAIPQACLLLGIPVLDTTTIPDELLEKTLKIPIPSTNPDPEPAGGYGPWNAAPFEYVARLYVALGATVYNASIEPQETTTHGEGR